MNLPEWFPEYARRIIRICHQGERTGHVMKLMKKGMAADAGGKVIASYISYMIY